MHRLVLPTAVLLLLAGCAPAPIVRLHDIYLYGTLNARLSYFYGDATEQRYGDSTLTLSLPDGTAARSDPYQVGGTLLVDGEPYLRQGVEPLGGAAITVSKIPLTTDVILQARIDTDQVVYFDGSSFLLLTDRGEANTRLRLVPRPLLNGLRSLGELSATEAEMLERQFREAGRPAGLAFLPKSSLPARAVDGLEEHRQTGIYVQTNVETDEDAFRPPPEELTWEVLSQGNQAVGFDSRTFELISDENTLIGIWNRAYGSSLTVPSLPQADFRRETLVGVFAGSKPTGGYGVQVEAVTEERGELYVDVRFSSPAPGAFTTQALTSPWVIVRVLRGGYQVVWLRDAETGELIGAARSTL